MSLRARFDSMPRWQQSLAIGGVIGLALMLLAMLAEIASSVIGWM